MRQGARSVPKDLEPVGEPYGPLTHDLALDCLWARDRLGAAAFPRDLGSDLAPPPSLQIG